MKKLFLTAILACAPFASFAEELNFNGTILTLSETAEKKVEQDRVRATLRIQSEGLTTQFVQDKVNRAMQKAVKESKSYSSIETSTGRYNVHQVWNGKKERYDKWKAAQTLIVDSEKKDDILKLAATLQNAGFVMDGLSYYLSREKEASYKNELIKKAMVMVKDRAQMLAESLGEDGYKVKKVNIGGRTYRDQPVHRMAKMEMLSMSADAGAAAPVVEGSDERISVSVNVTVLVGEE